MRSLVQEAATIEKAISQAWQKANKPQQFQVKILEEPERNFLGMVTRSAKVAVFFEETAATTQQQQPEKKKQHKEQREQQPREKQEKSQSQRGQQTQKSSGQTHKQKADSQKKGQEKQQKAQTQKQSQPEQTPEKQGQQKTQDSSQTQQKPSQKERKKPQSLWTQERVEHASTWLRDVLDKMGYTDISFTAEPQNLYLRIELSDHLLSRKDQEKQLLSSLASLMMTTMQRKYNKAFRGHKVVLTHP